MNTSILESELAPLNTQIEQVEQKREALESELRVVEAEINKFSADRQRFDALQDVCNALDKLSELKADELFWEGIPEAKDTARHVEQVRSRVARFEGEISGILEKQASYQEQINQCLDELQILDEEVRDAYDREERRKEEFVVEREISTVPYRAMIMPWSKEAESESRFRRAILVALILCFVFVAPIPLIKIPIPDRSDTVVEIPKRLVQLVKEDLPKPAPVKKPVPKQAQEEPKQAKEKPKPKPDKQHKPDKKPKGGGPAKEQTKLATAKGGGAAAARKKANHVGVLKFKDAFAGLMNETPVAKLGTEARLSNKSFRVKGQAVAQRSLVAIQGKGGSSGGISNFGVSRNIGNGNVGRLGGGGGSGIGDGTGSGVGFVRVESAIANLEESSRPTSDGLAVGRTDEEIQIVFDRYKAALYRIYNRELRKDPTLRGKILMRISIETNGSVSMCKMESTDLASPELVANIVERIKRFNFGPKEGVSKITILYPIDFLPAG
ncbi:MAG: AgmX/PglI C-terminal domain-containing protein [Desulfobacteraceae bacterium]|nr:AgmX/PglI C-terminal domain-containing protein [Desulfobacteraceae bacterium]